MKLHWTHFSPHGIVRAYSHLVAGRRLCRAAGLALRPLVPDSVNSMTAAYNVLQTLRAANLPPPGTLIDVGAILRQLQHIMDQVAQAVQFVFLFTLIAGVIVLYATFATAADERRYELAVMRALGARRDQLRRALLAEFAAVGGLAGLIAALGAIAVGQMLANRVFNFEVEINYWLPPLAVLAGAALVTGAGWFAAVRLMRAPPLEALRAGG